MLVFMVFFGFFLMAHCQSGRLPGRHNVIHEKRTIARTVVLASSSQMVPVLNTAWTRDRRGEWMAILFFRAGRPVSVS